MRLAPKYFRTITLHANRVLMSPASEQRLVKRMWEREKVFDSILALTLPCKSLQPSVTSQLV